VNFFNPFPVFHGKTQKSLLSIRSCSPSASIPPPHLHPTLLKEIFEREKTNKYEKKGRNVNEHEKEKKQAKAFCICFQGLFWVRMRIAMAFKKIYFRFPSIFLLIDPLVLSHRDG